MRPDKRSNGISAYFDNKNINLIISDLIENCKNIRRRLCIGNLQGVGRLELVRLHSLLKGANGELLLLERGDDVNHQDGAIIFIMRRLTK